MWVADFLDEYQPGAFRQAQVSFSSRIPNAIPLGDAMTIGANVDICNAGVMSFKEMMQAGQEQSRPASPNKKGRTIGLFIQRYHTAYTYT